MWGGEYFWCRDEIFWYRATRSRIVNPVWVRQRHEWLWAYLWVLERSGNEWKVLSRRDKSSQSLLIIHIVLSHENYIEAPSCKYPNYGERKWSTWRGTVMDWLGIVRRGHQSRRWGKTKVHRSRSWRTTSRWAGEQPVVDSTVLRYLVLSIRDGKNTVNRCIMAS